MIQKFAEENQIPRFRIKQFNQAFYQHFINNFDELTNWSKELREKLKTEVDFMSLDLEKEFISKRGDTVKVLFKRKKDGQRIETVLMRHKDGRNTVCVSCMVGCPVNCSFCATGKMGFGGNLTSEEIVDQVLHFSRYLKAKGEKVTNIVFMGMGEPMLNFPRVQEAINVFTDPERMGLSTRRITISTSGYITQFKKLIKNGFKGRLAISLHAPNQELRAKMMPVAKLYPLDKLMQAIDEYTEITNKRVTYEYVMIKGLNENIENAHELVHLFKHRLHHINLIPFNPIREADFERSSQERMKEFTHVLDKHGINYTFRITMGDDVNAACGQLADRENRKNTSKKIVTPE